MQKMPWSFLPYLPEDWCCSYKTRMLDKKASVVRKINQAIVSHISGKNFSVNMKSLVIVLKQHFSTYSIPNNLLF